MGDGPHFPSTPLFLPRCLYFGEWLMLSALAPAAFPRFSPDAPKRGASSNRLTFPLAVRRRPTAPSQVGSPTFPILFPPL